MDKEEFYLVSDNDYLVSIFEQELSFVRNHWFSPGRPTMTVMLTREMLGGLRGAESKSNRWRSNSAHSSKRNLLNFMMSLRSGKVGDVRVRLGRLGDMINTACIESLDFLVSRENSDYEDWDSLLRGSEGDRGCARLPHEEDANSPQRSNGAPGGRRRIRRRHSMDLLNVPKSPLASPWYTDEPVSRDNFRLHDHVDDESRLELGLDEQAIKVESPIKGLATNLFDDESPATVDASDRGERGSNTTSTPPETLTLTLNDSKMVDEAIGLLNKSANIYDQVDLLHYLQSCLGLDQYIDELGTISNLLEEVYIKAMHLRQWSVVRQAAGLLKKMVNSLTINIADLLVRQRPVTVGFGTEEVFITSPMNPGALKDLMYSHW